MTPSVIHIGFCGLGAVGPGAGIYLSASRAQLVRVLGPTRLPRSGVFEA